MPPLAINSPGAVRPSWAGPGLATALVFALSFLVLALSMAPEINPVDEGLILTGSMSVAAGNIPHRDFYALYGPGQFYVVAGLFDLFGQAVLVERLYDLVVKALLVSLVYLVSLQLMRTVYAALASAFCVLWIADAGNFPAYSVWPSLVLILASIWIALPLFRGTYSVTRLVLVGLCVGCVALFRYDMGMLALVVFSTEFALFGLLERQPFDSRARRLGALLAPFWGAAGLVLIVLATVYVRYGIAQDFKFQVVTYPSAYYVEMRGLPFPTISRHKLQEIIIYFPIVVLVGVLLLIASKFKQFNLRQDQHQEMWIAILIATFVAGLYFKGVVRVSIIHMMSSIIPSFILLGFALDRLMSRQRLFAYGGLAVPVVIAVVFAVVPSISAVRRVEVVVRDNLKAAIEVARSPISNSKGTHDERCDPEKSLTRARCFVLPDAELAAIRYVAAHSEPDQPILVANGINDKTFANNMAFYFLAGRQPATKWAEFDPGLQNSEPIQGDMVGELKRHQPPLVILDTEWDDFNEPNGSAKHSGVSMLDDYIHLQYQEVTRFDSYIVLQRKPVRDD
jgi:hypothetical protein